MSVMGHSEKSALKLGMSDIRGPVHEIVASSARLKDRVIKVQTTLVACLRNRLYSNGSISHRGWPVLFWAQGQARPSWLSHPRSRSRTLYQPALSTRALLVLGGLARPHRESRLQAIYGLARAILRLLRLFRFKHWDRGRSLLGSHRRICLFGIFAWLYNLLLGRSIISPK